MIQGAVEILFMAFLVAGIPVISWLTMRDPQVRTLPRRSLYVSAAISEWIVVALAAMAARVAGLGAAGIGLRSISPLLFAAWTVALASVSAAGLGVLLLLEKRGWWPDESDLVYLLMPRTSVEKAWALLLVAPTAALSEEFLYRGYLLAMLERSVHSSAWACILSSAAFGLAHLYQRPSGMLRAAALGALLAWPVVRTGSLYPSFAAHFLIDAAAFGWLGPRMMLGKDPWEPGGMPA